MSTKGITDLAYLSNRFSNHYLKDDCLFISYGGRITETSDSNSSPYERCQGWDERVGGNEIITILRGTRKYSDYDIEPLIEKLKWKKAYMQTEFPDQFDPECWDRIDVDELFIED